MWGSLCLIVVSTSVQQPSQVMPASRELLPPLQEMSQRPQSLKVKNPEQKHKIGLRIVRVLDAQLPSISDTDMQILMDVAKTTLREKLDFDAMEFIDLGALSIEEFFARYHDSASACSQRLEPWRFDPAGTANFEQAKPEMLRFLKRWTLAELKGFFSAHEAQLISSHEVLLERLIPLFTSKVKHIAAMRLPDGKLLLDTKKASYRSYVNWICSIRAQDAYDIVLTNEFVLYDLITEPYPHAIFKKCKVGGVSLRSPRNQAMGGRALMASTFGMSTNLPFFSEDPTGRLSHRERQEVTGMFILAHELGHALFKMPDFYDHPPQCLMTTRAETDYLAGYELLKAHPGPCPRCKPYIDARKNYFTAHELLKTGQYDKAIDLFESVASHTPTHVDGPFPAYLADIGLQIARGHWGAGRPRKAKRWLKSALRMNPWFHEAAEQWQRWFGSEPPHAKQAP